MPKISIIIPVYHVEKYLGECLDSVLGQTMRDIEIILVNDGGSEEDARIAEEYAGKDPRIVYIRQENRGLSGARNTGIGYARAEYLMFVDSDDKVDPRFCEEAYRHVTEGNCDMAIFDFQQVTDKENGWIYHSELEEGIYDDIRPVMEARMKRWPLTAYIWCKIYRKDLFQNIRFPEGEKWEDEAILHELIHASRRIAVFHEILYYKRWHLGSIMMDAYRTMEDQKWLFTQRRRMYLFAAEHYPEMVPLIAPDVVAKALSCASYYLLVAKDRQAFREIQDWVREKGPDPVTAGPRSRMAYQALRRKSPLFRIFAHIWLYRKEHEKDRQELFND